MEATARWRAAAARVATERPTALDVSPLDPSTPVRTVEASFGAHVAEMGRNGTHAAVLSSVIANATLALNPAIANTLASCEAVPKIRNHEEMSKSYVPTNISLSVARRGVSGHEAESEIVLPEIKGASRDEDSPGTSQTCASALTPGKPLTPSVLSNHPRTPLSTMVASGPSSGRPRQRRVKSANNNQRLEIEVGAGFSPGDRVQQAYTSLNPAMSSNPHGNNQASSMAGTSIASTSKNQPLHTPTTGAGRRATSARLVDSPSRAAFITQSGTPVRAVVDSGRSSQRPTSSRRTKPLSNHRPSHLDGVASMLPWNNPKMTKKRIPIVSEIPFQFRKKKVSVRDLAKAHQRQRRDPRRRSSSGGQSEGETRHEDDGSNGPVPKDHTQNQSAGENSLSTDLPQGNASETAKSKDERVKSGKFRPPTLDLTKLVLEKPHAGTQRDHMHVSHASSSVSMSLKTSNNQPAPAEIIGEVPEISNVVSENKLSEEDQMARSFHVSETGSLKIHGFEIQESGITRAPSGVLPSLSMRDGLIKLSLLGRGASGVVREMLHEPSLSLVAVKSIPCFEQRKRLQMIKELKALYANLVPVRKTPSRSVGRPFSAGNATRDRLAVSDVGGSNTTQGNAARTSASTGTRDDGALQNPACPYIVAFYDAFVNPQEGSVNIVMEYMDGGSLQDVVDAGGCDSEDVLSVVAESVVRGLMFLHNRRQIHRDIKPSNLLLNGKGEVKISDFGIIRDVTEDQANAHTFVGTMVYMSPERINGEAYSFASDIWSFGLTLMTCALGLFPFRKGGSYWDMLNSINNDPIPQLPADQFSVQFVDFVNRCLCKDPLDRPTAAELLKHPFVRDRQTNQPSPQTEPADIQPLRPSPGSAITPSPRPETSPLPPKTAVDPTPPAGGTNPDSCSGSESREKLEEICTKLVDYQLSKILEADQKRIKARESYNTPEGDTTIPAANATAASANASVCTAPSTLSGQGIPLDPETTDDPNGAAGSGANAARRRKKLNSKRRSEPTPPTLTEMGKCSCNVKGSKCAYCMTTTIGPQSHSTSTSTENQVSVNTVPFNLRKYTRDECVFIADQIGIDAAIVKSRVNAHIGRANEFLRRSRLYAS